MSRTPRENTGGRRPNFVVVMTDDQGFWARSDLTPELRMPHLGRLAGRSRDFTRAFCASPVCSPARASVLTGQMPSAHGVHDWLRTGMTTHEPWEFLDGLTTTPMLLAEAGYRCGHVGKWHLGHAQHPAPGFTDWKMVHQGGGGPYFRAPVWIDGQPANPEGYLTTLINNDGASVLTDMLAGDQPFYLQVHYTAPHTPWGAEHHPREYLDLYADCDFPSLPRRPIHPWFNRADGELGRAAIDPPSGLRGMAASLTAVDDGLGQLLDILDGHDRGADTYLIFLSDNGFNCGHHGIWGKGNGTRPLNMYEESVRVPFLVAGPNVPVGVDETLISAAGLHATITDLADLAVPPDPLSVAGSFARRLTPSTASTPAGSDEFVTVYDEYGGTRMIRTERYKYVHRHAGPDELYDLVNDPEEVTNLADDRSHRVLRDDLLHTLTDWFSTHTDVERDAFTRPISGSGQYSPTWTNDPDAARYA